MLVTKSLKIDAELWDQAKAKAALAEMTLVDWIAEAIKEKLHPSNYTKTAEFKRQAVKYCESKGYVLINNKSAKKQVKEKKPKKGSPSPLGKRKEEEDSLLGI